MMDPVRVAASQFAPAGRNRAEALEEASEVVRRAAAAGARILLLPELFAWPYFAGHDPAAWRGEAEPVGGAVGRWAAASAARSGVAILAPLYLREEDGRRSNAVLLADPDGDVGIVARKIHLPPGDDAGWGEADHFTAGPPQVAVFPVAGLRAAVLVCYDRRFPECWRAARAGGADVVFVPVAGPADEPAGFFAAELCTHARGSGLYAVSASRTGHDRIGTDTVRHDGDTLVVAPDGAVMAGRGQAEGPGLVLADIDPVQLAACRARFPYFDQRLAVIPAPQSRPS